MRLYNNMFALIVYKTLSALEGLVWHLYLDIGDRQIKVKTSFNAQTLRPVSEEVQII